MPSLNVHPLNHQDLQETSYIRREQVKVEQSKHASRGQQLPKPNPSDNGYGCFDSAIHGHPRLNVPQFSADQLMKEAAQSREAQDAAMQSPENVPTNSAENQARNVQTATFSSAPTNSCK